MIEFLLLIVLLIICTIHSFKLQSRTKKILTKIYLKSPFPPQNEFQQSGENKKFFGNFPYNDDENENFDDFDPTESKVEDKGPADDDDPPSAMQQFTAIAQNFYKSLFFYGLQESDSNQPKMKKPRKAVENSRSFRQFCKSRIDSIFLTKQELLALYLASTQRNLLKRNKQKTQEFETSPNSDDLVLLKQQKLLLKMKIKEIETEMKTIEISLKSMEDGEADDSLELLLRNEWNQLEKNLQEKKIQLVTIETKIFEIEES
jgi:hypothetical protein